ncbi:MAG: glycosyltransferase family 4 protein [Chloroflexi bacterium]|nr:glycosyltransferase family 4 protein [Chloroflexota bacterium]
MRILMLTDLYPPIVGGTEQHVRALSSELGARGHEVAVATLWQQGLPTFELDGRVRVYRIRGTTQRLPRLFSDSGRRYAAPLPDPEASWALARVVARERPAIVHAHSWLVHSYLPLRARGGPRLVMTLHDFSLVCAKKNFLYRDAACSGPAWKKCLECCAGHYGTPKGVPTVVANQILGAVERVAVDMFLPVSRAVAAGSGLAANGLPYHTIPNFLPDDLGARIEEPDAYLSQLPCTPFLLFVGALGRHKGIHVLLRAYAELPEAPPLVLIGSPWPDMPSEFPPNVVVLRNWPRHAVVQAWERSILGLVPSVGPEGLPTVALEAMAAGRPVIASRIGGLPELVDDGETGLLVPPDDHQALAEALRRLLAEPERRVRMGRAAARKADQFRASQVVPRIERIYRQLAAPVST